MQGRLIENLVRIPSLVKRETYLIMGSDARTSESLAIHLRKTLRIYGYFLPLVVALAFSVGLSITAFIYKAESDVELLNSVEEDVAEILSGDDISDADRLFHSIRGERKSTVILLHGNTIASSSSHEKFAKHSTFTRPRTFNLGYGISLSRLGLLTETQVHGMRTDQDYRILMLSPFGPILRPIMWLALGILVGGFVLARIYARQMVRSVTKALNPVSKLHRAIRSLPFTKELELTERTGVRELDLILSAILEAHRELANARDIQAANEAQKMTSFAYEALIHDLLSPTAALRNLVESMRSPSINEAERNEICETIVQLTEQVLSQVATAKSHLAMGPVTLQSIEIGGLVDRAIQSSALSSAEFRKKKVVRTLPSLPIPLPCDPSLLLRALTNLIHNALEASKKEINVQVSSTPTTVHVVVSDDGVGMSYEDVSLYLQGRKKSTKADRPSLGLAATQHIVRAHGGKLIYRTSDLGGASFEMQLPNEGSL